MIVGEYGPKGSASFSADRIHRYTLVRRLLDQPRKVTAFICLNPSTADAFIEDPTVRRCLGYASKWGSDSLLMLNIFALRSTDPRVLYGDVDPVGPENDAAIQLSIAGLKPERVICAWGNHGDYCYRGRAVLDLLARMGIEPLALKVNAGGQPAHPLYLPANLEPKPFV